MKTFSLGDIRKLNPCYDPIRYLEESWVGTLVDILRVTDCPAEDRVWVVTGFLDDRTNRLFAVWCARNALSLIDNPDPRSIAACDIAERYANGVATNYELAAAWYAARDAAWDAAWDAARYAARAAAWYAARYAAWYAAWDAARYAAGDAAGDAAWYAQIQHLIEMIEASDAAL